MSTLLRLTDVSVRFEGTQRLVGRGTPTLAVDHVDLTVGTGDVVGIVGESGAGKSSVGLAIVRSLPLASGRIEFDDRDVTDLRGRALRRYRRDVQMVFQDPYGSLPPRLTVGDIITEPLVIHGELRARLDAERRMTVAGELLEACGLPASAAHRRAEQFSGGQRQRIAIARALSVRPRLLVADEPTSALDVSVQAQILDLLQRLRVEHGLTMILISHNLAVVRNVTNRVVVMRTGRVVESAPTEELFADPLHPYTRRLLRSVTVPDPEIERVQRLARRVERDDAPTAETSTGAQLVEVSAGHLIRQ